MAPVLKIRLNMPKRGGNNNESITKRAGPDKLRPSLDFSRISKSTKPRLILNMPKTGKNKNGSIQEVGSQPLAPLKKKKSRVTLEAEKRSLASFKKRFTLIRRIAKGSEGTTFTCMPTRAARALKRSGDALEHKDLKVAKFAFNEGDRATKEIVATRNLPASHNFVAMEDYDRDEKLWLVTPLMTGSTLYHFRVQTHLHQEPITGSLFWHIFIEMVEAVGKLHDAGMTHFDLISCNVFVDPNDKPYKDYPRIKLGDFGRAKWNEFLGRRKHPEYTEAAKRISSFQANDVWHIAAMMYCLRYSLIDVNEHLLYHEQDRRLIFEEYKPPRGKKRIFRTKPIHLNEDEEELFQKLIGLCNSGHRSIAAWKEHAILEEAEHLRNQFYQPLSEMLKTAFKRMSAATVNLGNLGGHCKEEVVEALGNPDQYSNPFDGKAEECYGKFWQDFRNSKPPLRPKKGEWPSSRMPKTWATFHGELPHDSPDTVRPDPSSSSPSNAASTNKPLQRPSNASPPKTAETHHLPLARTAHLSLPLPNAKPSASTRPPPPIQGPIPWNPGYGHDAAFIPAHGRPRRPSTPLSPRTLPRRPSVEPISPLLRPRKSGVLGEDVASQAVPDAQYGQSGRKRGSEEVEGEGEVNGESQGRDDQERGRKRRRSG
ncbi:MAG: hypothetical protein M1831_004366 [Alyxoria varia]|nr:MAG: hypothetical protein M1831_004366 [Alyxoria varia]